MKASLVAISIGPVQEFISAARRTRDLWFGSHLLSELSKTVARCFSKIVGTDGLIFPAPESTNDLEDNSQFNVANIILVCLPTGRDPAATVEEARITVAVRWKEFTEQARKTNPEMIRNDIWSDQVDDVIEFYAAWVPLEEDYKESRRKVMRLLAGRKSCRNFVPAKGKAGLPKSSLDGSRETVLKECKPSLRLPLLKGEQLDVIGVTKRTGGGTQSYPSLARIAAEPWLRTFATTPTLEEPFEKIKSLCKDLADKNLLGREQSHTPYNNFPFDGECVYVHRHKQLVEEIGSDIAGFCDLAKLLSNIYHIPGLGEPCPYLAVLVADGDQVGKFLGCLDMNEHRSFSRSLAKFSRDSARIMEEFHGICIYAGGDDVLGLVPISEVLGCTRALHDSFSKSLSTLQQGGASISPTLSIGVAIGHFMEPLEDLLAYGRSAEQAAKRSNKGAGETDSVYGARNGLCVQINSRSGSPVSIRERWQGSGSSLDRRILKLSKLELPNKLPYDLRKLAHNYSEDEAEAPLLQADLRLLLKRKMIGSGQADYLVESVKRPADLLRLSDELIVAQWLRPTPNFAETQINIQAEVCAP